MQKHSCQVEGTASTERQEWSSTVYLRRARCSDEAGKVS